MTQSKDIRHRHQAELLGMPHGVAEKKLRLAVMHEFARQLGKDRCCRCGQQIASPDDFALTHLQDWQENPDLYWDLTNVTFSHASCEAARGQGGEKKMRVEVKIEDTQSNRLPGVNHKGTIYVAGKLGDRYNLKLRNLTAQRLLVVPTVDGRNTINGAPGSFDGPGHILPPFGEALIEGWRQTDNTVAAFRFGEKSDSYSEQMGTPENVGVIGIAVFEERVPERSSLTVKTLVPIYPDPWWWPRLPPRGPYWISVGDSSFGSPFEPQGLGGTTIRYTGMGTGGIGGGTFCSTSCSVAPESGVQSESVFHQALGTEYGETIASAVVKADFTRSSAHPVEVVEIRYDSLEALQQQGIMAEPPSNRPRPPKAFPEAPKVAPGYATPPPRPSRVTR